MRRAVLFIFCAWICAPVIGQQTVTTVILVRHAEKGTDDPRDPELTDAGKARAESLARLLAKTKVDAIYSTAYKRTRNTVGPLAQSKNLSLRTYDASKMSDIDAMLSEFNGGTIVVCGHSNTTPALANYLTGHKDEFKAFEDGDYGNVLVVSVVKRGELSKVTWMTY